METPLERSQVLLREPCQFDCADLDFGIYRITNHKQAVIARFIAEDLPKALRWPLFKERLFAPVEV